MREGRDGVMLEVIGISCGYGRKNVLKRVSFSARTHEILGVIGPNGSGKTTLLRVLTKVIRPLEGQVLWDGREVREFRLKELARKVAVVSQNAAYESHITVGEFVLFGRIPHRQRYQFFETAQDRARAEEAMTQTGISQIRDRMMGNLSGGERQLACIARALCQEPKCLVLDEPTAHLDITHQVEILDLIRRLNREESIGVIVVLHDLNFASEYCDRLVLLQRGKVFRTGTPDEVLSYPIIEEVYQTTVVVSRNPLSTKPYILVVSEEERLRTRD